MLYKKVLFLSLSLSFSLSAFSQSDTSYWKKGGIFSLGFNQFSLSRWASGGVNSISGNTLLNTFLNYKKGYISWENTLELQYGLTRQGESENNFIKGDDKIDFASKFGYKMKKYWYYSMLFNFKSQFDKGYKSKDKKVIISDFFSPAYFIFSLGLDYVPNKNFSALMGALTGKITVVSRQELADIGAFKVPPAEYDNLGNLLKRGKNYRAELGGFFKITARKEILKNVSFSAKLELFSNYLEKPENIDLNGEFLIIMKANKFLSASLLFHAIYDDDIDIAYKQDGVDKIGPALQLKQLLGLGITYNF